MGLAHSPIFKANVFCFFFSFSISFFLLLFFSLFRFTLTDCEIFLVQNFDKFQICSHFGSCSNFEFYSYSEVQFLNVQILEFKKNSEIFSNSEFCSNFKICSDFEICLDFKICPNFEICSHFKFCSDFKFCSNLFFQFSNYSKILNF
jgi:hypothetical protein